MTHLNQPRTGEHASTGRKREQWMVSDRWIVRRLIGTLVILLVLFIVLRNRYFPQLFVPPPNPPDMVWNFPASIAVWGGRIYTGESETITGVFDINSGKRVTTIPEIVVGSDARFLYANTGGRARESHSILVHAYR